MRALLDAGAAIGATQTIVDPPTTGFKRLPRQGWGWFTCSVTTGQGGTPTRAPRRRWSASDVQEALVISGQIPLWLVDGDDRIAFVNDAAVELLGYDSEDELVGRPSHDAVHYKHPDGSPYPAEDCPITHATRRGEPVVIERDWWVRKDGSMLPISIHCVQMEIDGRMGTAMTFHDQTAVVQAEKERRSLEVQRARLAAVRASRSRIVEAADAQRRRVVRDLHDGAQASLVRVVIALKLAVRSDLTDEAGGFVAEALDNANLAIQELRELAHGIHPAALTEHGLARALQDIAERAPVPVVVDVAAERYPEPVEAAAYFVAAEALTNVAKYARASAARVATKRTDGQLVLTVDDDGVGGARPSSGGGLAGLADRLATVEGRLTVTSEPGEGTHVSAEIPLSVPTLASAAAALEDPDHETSVLIVDDDPKFRALAAIMLRERGFDVVGESADAASAVEAAAALRPSAIVLDVNLPDYDGFWVAEALNAAGIGSRILLTSSSTTIDASVRSLDHRGIVAFIDKAELPTTDLSALLR
jgi:PAS domain S-box-containing protein